MSIPPAPKNGTGEIRQDLAPLTTRFPLLDGVKAALWISGTTGSSTVPGPSTYWIDAIIDLPPGRSTQWRQEFKLTPAPNAPDLASPLDKQLPPPPYEASAALNAAIRGTGGFACTAHLSGDTLVLSCLGQP
jgi:hypothetical protein